MAKVYVLIVIESDTEDSVISNLNPILSITQAFGTFGTYDILTKLESEMKKTYGEISQIKYEKSQT